MKKLMLAICCIMVNVGCSANGVGTDDVQDDADAISGGSAADISDFPWQVSIQMTSGAPLCGGSILNERYVLTSRGCVAPDPTPGGMVSPHELQVAAGSSLRSKMRSEGQVVRVEDIVPLPGFVEPMQGKDIALVRLSRPLSFNAKVRPIRIATRADEQDHLTKPGTQAVVTGWGGRQPFADQDHFSDRLQKASLPILAFEDAKAIYEPFDVTITPDQLPAGQPGSSKDSCFGDGGGPLVVKKGNTPILAGVASWPLDCGDSKLPGLYVRTSSFEGFIRRIMNTTPTTLIKRENITGSKDQFHHFEIDVPAGKAVVNFHLEDGHGNGALFVRRLNKPTKEQFDVMSDTEGGDESCTINNPAAGRWYASVRGSSAFSGITLRVTAY